MSAQEWFESFFVQGHFAEELDRVSTRQTEREVAFIVETLALPAGARILDLCCGVGRHTVPLATRGYLMAGLDLDLAALERAERRADEAAVDVAWHQADMRDIPYQGELDGVLNLGGSWAYYETDDEDSQVLASVARALKPGGLFL
jgi:SAM-dependent methyltransferase